MILTFAVSGYRSLRDLVLPLERLNIVTGPNGSGKSSFYKALRLLADVAQGRIISSLAVEGGLQSTLWAGPEAISRAIKTGAVPIQGTTRRGRVSLRLGFAADDYGYAVDLGLPTPAGGSRFNRDPEIKSEAVWAGDVLRRSNAFATRRGPAVQVLDDKGRRATVINDLPPFDSMMTHAADPRGAPELLALRERMRGWRFYDHFRTDPHAPARRPQVGTRTPVLAADGADLAAALQTIGEIGDDRALDAAIEDAFPGGRIAVSETDGWFEVSMFQHGLLRPIRSSELSDGTLRYLLLAAALLTPRPPSLMVLNEPETSLHPDLLEPLGRLIAKASENVQIIVVAHPGRLSRCYPTCADVGQSRCARSLAKPKRRASSLRRGHGRADKRMSASATECWRDGRFLLAASTSCRYLLHTGGTMRPSAYRQRWWRKSLLYEDVLSFQHH